MTTTPTARATPSAQDTVAPDIGDSQDIMFLIVDLDGTLLRSDMLYESFWSAFGRNWRVAFSAVAAVRRGRASLKRHLASVAHLEPASLPYDETVLNYIRDWRDRGGKTALVTASDQSIADKIAAHLGLFDEVYGSDGEDNLKGARKATFLTDRFGAGTFVYMGDSEADLPVWQASARGVTVNASAALRSRSEAAAPEMAHLDTTPATAASYVRALRPHQWLKNSLVFLPMLAGHQFDMTTVMLSIMAFVAFSVIASSVYVLNDMIDLSADRAHPRKRLRPFASGAVPLSHGMIMSAVLLMIGAGLALLVGPAFFLLISGYYILTTAYSLSLKRQMVIDICVLAGLYSMRIAAGALATGIPLSVWLMAFAIFFFLSLAAVKRQAELVDSQKRGTLKARGRGYTVGDLPIITMIAISAGYVSVQVLVLYLNSPSVSELYNFPGMLWGIGAVALFWITRTVMLAHRGLMNDDPVVYAARDRVSQVCLLLCVGFAVAGTF